MAILRLVAFIIVIAALAGVWRARGRGSTAMQAAIMLLIVAVVAAVAIWLVLPRF